MATAPSVSDQRRRAPGSSAMMPWSTALRTRIPVLTLAAVQHRPTSTPRAMPARRSRVSRRISRHPWRLKVRSSVPSAPAVSSASVVSLPVTSVTGPPSAYVRPVPPATSGWSMVFWSLLTGSAIIPLAT